MNIDADFDGHSERDFKTMTAEERLDDLSRKIALMLELRFLATSAGGRSMGKDPSEGK